MISKTEKYSITKLGNNEFLLQT